MTASPRALPFSRPLLVATLPSGGRDIRIEATESERQALAEAFKLEGIKSLVGRLTVTPVNSGVKVTGDVEGRITQICTVSLDPFDADVTEPVDLTFMPEAGVAAWLAQHRPDPAADLAFESDPPDVITDGKIDLGAVASEFLALGLDPYPRKPGIMFDHAAGESEKEPSPFAALAQLTKKN